MWEQIKKFILEHSGSIALSAGVLTAISICIVFTAPVSLPVAVALVATGATTAAIALATGGCYTAKEIIGTEQSEKTASDIERVEINNTQGTGRTNGGSSVLREITEGQYRIATLEAQISQIVKTNEAEKAALLQEIQNISKEVQTIREERMKSDLRQSSLRGRHSARTMHANTTVALNRHSLFDVEVQMRREFPSASEESTSSDEDERRIDNKKGQ